MKLRNFIRTCMACPSQWDAITDDGRAVYVRYRWGHLSVSVAAAGDTDEYAAVRGERVLELELGDEYDGSLADEDLQRVLREHGLVDESAGEAVGALTRADLDRLWEAMPARLEALGIRRP